jgi:hypothetical protein
MAAIAIVASVLVGCHSLTPSGFWKGYRSDSIVKQFSDQGPWGGERWILWQAVTTEGFSEADAQRFAVGHGWKFLERVEVSAASIGTSSLFKKESDLARENFPKLISGESVVLKFESGWMCEDPGTNEMSTAYGYVQLSKDGRQMVVYHHWGNG